MPKLRIAILMWKDGIGGAERSLCDLASAIDKQYFEVHFYYLSGKADYFSKRIENSGFCVSYLEWKNGYDWSGRIQLILKLKQFSPHIIHDHILPPLTRPFIKLFLLRPIINTEHGTALQRQFGKGKKWRKFIERFDFFFCDYIAANSKASAIALEKTYRLSIKKIGVIYLGIDTNHFKKSPKKIHNSKILRIGYLGRIVNSLKGVDRLVLIAKNLHNHNGIKFKFIIAGEGEDRIKTEQFCEKMGVKKYFNFLGWVPDVKSFLETIDILIVPSRFESLGLSSIEALSMNIPVAAFDLQGLRETLAGCSIGTLVPPGNINKMTEAVIKLYKNKKEHDNSGRHFVQKRFSNDTMAQKYQDLYFSFIQ
ncbi:MAG: glycosyltransferase family 4 protein [Desulfobacteraceae bacterium]|nr:glycosyltransferase family 4 protein [Desulfobacteraceae bacterium]